MTPRKPGRMPSELMTALIAAFFGLAGVLAGGLITYVTNRSVQDREIERQEQRELRAASTAAAMESFRFQSAGAQLDAVVVSRRDTAFTPEYLRSRLAAVDIATMLGHLGASQAEAYAHAQLCLSSVATVMRGHPAGARLSSHDVRALRVHKECVDEGQDALDRLVAR